MPAETEIKRETNNRLEHFLPCVSSPTGIERRDSRAKPFNKDERKYVAVACCFPLFFLLLLLLRRRRRRRRFL